MWAHPLKTVRFLNIARGYRNFKSPFSRILNVAADARAVKRALSHPNAAVFSTSLTIFRRNADVTSPISFRSERQHERGSNASLGPVPIQSDLSIKPPQTDPAARQVHAVAAARLAPKFARMRAMAAGSSIAAMSFSRPPQCWQRLMSMSNTVEHALPEPLMFN